MILVAIFGKTGFFDYVALKVRIKLYANECNNENFHWLIKMLFFNQLGAKPKSTIVCTRAFSRAYSPRLTMGRNSYTYLALDTDQKKAICQV